MKSEKIRYIRLYYQFALIRFRVVGDVDHEFVIVVNGRYPTSKKIIDLSI